MPDRPRRKECMVSLPRRSECAGGGSGRVACRRKPTSTFLTAATPCSWRLWAVIKCIRTTLVGQVSRVHFDLYLDTGSASYFMKFAVCSVLVVSSLSLQASVTSTCRVECSGSSFTLLLCPRKALSVNSLTQGRQLILKLHEANT